MRGGGGKAKDGKRTQSERSCPKQTWRPPKIKSWNLRNARARESEKRGRREILPEIPELNNDLRFRKPKPQNNFRRKFPLSFSTRKTRGAAGDALYGFFGNYKLAGTGYAPEPPPTPRAAGNLARIYGRRRPT